MFVPELLFYSWEVTARSADVQHRVAGAAHRKDRKASEDERRSKETSEEIAGRTDQSKIP